MDREYAALKKLRAGEVLEIEGCKVKRIPGDIIPGDWYVAERNTGPKLLTAKAIHKNGWIVPVESQYPYDVHECVRVCIEFPQDLNPGPSRTLPASRMEDQDPDGDFIR